MIIIVGDSVTLYKSINNGKIDLKILSCGGEWNLSGFLPARALLLDDAIYIDVDHAEIDTIKLIGNMDVAYVVMDYIQNGKTVDNLELSTHAFRPAPEIPPHTRKLSEIIKFTDPDLCTMLTDDEIQFSS